MKCEYCGAELPEDSIFCNICGKPIREVDGSEDLYDEILLGATRERERAGSAHAKEKQTKQPLPKGVVVSLILILVALLFVLLTVLFSRAGGLEPAPLTGQAYYEQELALLEEAITKKNYGEAHTHYENALACEGSDTYMLLLQSLLIAEGEGDNRAQEKTLQEIVGQAAQMGYLSDERDAYEKLLALYERQKDTAKRDALVKELFTSDDESFRNLVASYRPLAPVFGNVPKDARPGEPVSVSCAADCELILRDASGGETRGEGELSFALSAGDNHYTAVCVNAYGMESEEGVFDYYLSTVYAVEMPRVAPDSGEYTQGFLITVDVPEGLSAYYSWDDTPTVSSTPYTGAIDPIEGNHVFAVILVDAYGNTSNVQRVNYIYMPLEERAPEDMDTTVQ